ncbi:MAG: NAD(P)/FAD-dependent oxidoreductase [Candidatus Margulisiibacteriota bacterium]
MIKYKNVDKVRVVIIGAGVVGLAVAAELSKKNSDIVLLEKESSFGQHTSSRNSEIIHAGIYYPKDTLKARLCVEGKHLLYEFCQKYHIPHQKLGKIIVATNHEEIAQLEDLNKKAKDNGVEDLVWLTKSQITELEPSVKGELGLFSPSSGIIDSHSLMKALEQQAKENGAIVAYNSEVTSISNDGKNYRIYVNHEEALATEVLINCGGLFSDKIAQMVGINLERYHYRLYYCKGEYFSYRKPSFLKHLVYPVPEAEIKSLGIHSIIDLSGHLKFGPSAEYVTEVDYQVNPAHRDKFAQAVQNLFPQVHKEDLLPDQAGIRPKLQGPNQTFRDFVISEESDKGFPGMINLIGIESPGLTCCLAIARYVCDKLL